MTGIVPLRHFMLAVWGTQCDDIRQIHYFPSKHTYFIREIYHLCYILLC